MALWWAFRSDKRAPLWISFWQSSLTLSFVFGSSGITMQEANPCHLIRGRRPSKERSVAMAHGATSVIPTDGRLACSLLVSHWRDPAHKTAKPEATMSPTVHPPVPDQTLTWRRSSRCSIGSCVEVARTPSAFLVRDSKQSGVHDQPVIALDAGAWPDLLDALALGRTQIDLDGLSVRCSEDGSVTLFDSGSTTTLQFDRDEWSAFVASAIEGEFS